MRWFLAALLLLASGIAAAQNSFSVLCYHEVRDDVRDYPDPFAVDTGALVRQFEWLRGNGYTPVSLEAILAARAGGKPLPDKAVLLTFDDAYLSFHSRVYPLLRQFGYPALLGVVGSWIEAPPGSALLYGEQGTVSNATFPTWRQLREMADSGLVELSSHSYDLHRGVLGNPQGNLQPAATTRSYDAATGRYEDDIAWRARVRADLARNSALIERETGRRPRAMVWPYGSYNDELVRIAADLGMPTAFTLEEGINTPQVPMNAGRRILIAHNPTLSEFSLEMRGPLHPAPLRVVQVDLGTAYDADVARQEANLSALLDRMQVLKPTHVILQATVDGNGDGIADGAWFPNRHLPLRADLFNRVAWQLASRLDIKVYAAMPVAGLRLPPEQAAEVYEDLARHAAIDGLVFNDGDAAATGALANRARAFRAPLKTMARARTAQDAAGLAAANDYVAVSEMPLNPAALAPDLRRKLVYLLPAGGPLAAQLRALQLGGDLNFGYADDDFLRSLPRLAEIAPAMSLRMYPADKAADKEGGAR